MRGFSLLEIIVAISVLAVGIAGAVGLISRTIQAGSVVKKQLIGWHLAQEGMEIAYNIRSTNWIEKIAWGDGLDGGTLSNPKSYCANFDSTSLISPCSGASRNLYFDSSVNRYTHSGTASTDFSRYLEISDGDDLGTPFKLIKSIVTWSGGSATAEERLYNWK